MKLRAASPVLLVMILAMVTGRCLPQTQPVTPNILVLHLNDTIQPISEEYLERGLARAAEDRDEAVLVTLNTPGGLLDATRSMVGKILASPVPVIVYISPSGSRAGSAGFFLLQAADVAAMAPGTNAGAAHPVVEGAKLDDTMREKLENDTTAFLRSYVARRNRNVDAAQDAVLHSKSYTEREALDLHVIDLIAASDSELLNLLDGRKIQRFEGQSQTLHTAHARLIGFQPSLREQILDRLMDPNLAVLILVMGGLLIYMEFNAPGTIIPGALGTLLLVTGLFALNLLPVHYTAIMFLIAAFTLLLVEAKIPSHGVLAGAGIIALVFGTLTLVDGPIPELRVHTATAIACGLAFGLITVFLVRIALRARRAKMIFTGAEALVGKIGIAQQPLDPSGQILVHGELWQAESASPVERGVHVRVIGLRGYTLLVEQVPAVPPPAQ